MRCRCSTIALVAWTTSACGRVGFDVRGDADAADSGPSSFGLPIPIDELEDPTYDQDDPSLTWDLLEIYFTSNRLGGAGGCDVWSSRRTTSTALWDPPASVPGINAALCDSGPEIAADGLTLFFSSDRDGNADIYMTTRTTRTAPWSAPVKVAELSFPAIEHGPSLTMDLLTIVMDSWLSGTNADLYQSSRASTLDTWSVPVAITELATSGTDRSPWLSATGLTLWFVSDRSGGVGVEDLWVTTRPSATAPFAAPSPVAELNTADNEDDPWVAPDGRSVYFARRDSAGHKSLFVARR